MADLPPLKTRRVFDFFRPFSGLIFGTKPPHQAAGFLPEGGFAVPKIPQFSGLIFGMKLPHQATVFTRMAAPPPQ